MVLCAILISSCSNSNKKIIGRWKVASEQSPKDAIAIVYSGEDYFRFRKDAFLRSNSDTHFSDYWGSDACKYEMNDGTLSIYYSKTSENIDKKFSYNFDNDTNLTLVYIKPEAVAGRTISLVKVSQDPE